MNKILKAIFYFWPFHFFFSRQSLVLRFNVDEGLLWFDYICHANLLGSVQDPRLGLHAQSLYSCGQTGFIIFKRDLIDFLLDLVRGRWMLWLLMNFWPTDRYLFLDWLTDFSSFTFASKSEEPLLYNWLLGLDDPKLAGLDTKLFLRANIGFSCFLMS